MYADNIHLNSKLLRDRIRKYYLSVYMIVSLELFNIIYIAFLWIVFCCWTGFSLRSVYVIKFWILHLSQTFLTTSNKWNKRHLGEPNFYKTLLYSMQNNEWLMYWRWKFSTNKSNFSKILTWNFHGTVTLMKYGTFENLHLFFKKL